LDLPGRLDAHPGRLVLHPALPGMFPGVDAIAGTYEAFRAGMITHTGVMIHYVPDEEVDVGPLIASELVPIYEHDTLQSLEERVHETEHRLYVKTLHMLTAL
jgi:folate-dependent phosphoribosylglycinamide formyltransferase PurN